MKSVIFQSHASNLLDQKEYSKFSYCYTDLGAGCSAKETIDSFFRKVLLRISRKYNMRLLCNGDMNGNKNITW